MLLVTLGSFYAGRGRLEDALMVFTQVWGWGVGGGWWGVGGGGWGFRVWGFGYNARVDARARAWDAMRIAPDVVYVNANAYTCTHTNTCVQT